MIIPESVLHVSDNSGARIVKCIRVLGGSFRQAAVLGNPIRVCIRSIDLKKKLLKKSIYTGLIVATRKSVRRLDGTYFRSDRNRCLIMSREGDKFLGTRVDGPIPREIRGGHNEVKYKQIISYAPATI